MKNSMNKMRAEFDGQRWAFVDESQNKVPFDQAVIDATYTTKTVVEGFVVSVHGVDHALVESIPSKVRHAIGIKAVHSLGQGPTLRRLRLIEGGVIERA